METFLIIQCDKAVKERKPFAYCGCPQNRLVFLLICKCPYGKKLARLYQEFTLRAKKYICICTHTCIFGTIIIIITFYIYLHA